MGRSPKAPDPLIVPLFGASDPRVVGGKAHGLWRAIRRNLPVPPGHVLAGDAREIPPLELARLEATRFAVRSSATFEDRPGVGAAGLLLTRLDVTADAIAAAVDACRASARADHVRAYLEHRRVDAASVAVAVIVQAMVGPGRRGVLATRDPAGSGLARLEEDDAGAVRATLVAREALAEPLRSALVLEEDFGGPVEIEWAESAGAWFVLQARRAPPAATIEEFRVEFADAEERSARWRWDREHNPTPISPAHQGLVEAVDRAAGGGMLRVWNGTLYERDPAGVRHAPAATAAQPRPAADPIAAGDVSDPAGALRHAVDGFCAFAVDYHAEARAHRLAATPDGSDTTEEVPPALARDQELWRLARAAVHAPGLLEYLRDPSRPAPPSLEMAEWFAALRAHLDRWGDFAPAWDVATTTYAEDPRPLFPALVRLATDDTSPLDRHARHGGGAGSARAHGEADDLRYAGALRTVRRALLGVGRAWVGAGRLDAVSDVFFVPLADLLGSAPSDARAVAAAGRARREALRRVVPPLSIHGDHRVFARPAGDVLSGAGVGGRARGPAVVIRDAAAVVAPAPGAVLVVPSVLPPMTFLLATAAAVVTDHGGLLDHGAFMAREYGLPAVVGTFWATRVLRDGKEVVVDGEAGRVYTLPSDASG